MSEPKRDVDERLADWVDGCMSARERERFVAELRVNARLRQDLADYERTVAALREALQAPTAPSPMADRVIAALAAGRTATVAVHPRWRRPHLWLSIASAAALLLGAWWIDRVSGGDLTTATVAKQEVPAPASTGNAAPGRDVLVSKDSDYVEGANEALAKPEPKASPDPDGKSDQKAQRDATELRDQKDMKKASAPEVRNDLAELQVEGGGTDLMRLGASRFGSPPNPTTPSPAAPAVPSPAPFAADKQPAPEAPKNERVAPSEAADPAAVRSVPPSRGGGGGTEAPGAPAAPPPRADGGRKPPPPTSDAEVEAVDVYELAKEKAATPPSPPAGQAKAVVRRLTFVLVEGPAEAAPTGGGRGAASRSREEAKGDAPKGDGAKGETAKDDGSRGLVAPRFQDVSSGVRATDQPLDADALRERIDQFLQGAADAKLEPATAQWKTAHGTLAVSPWVGEDMALGSTRRSSAEERRAASAPSERMWLVEGDKRDVEALLARVGAFAGRNRLTMRSGEMPEPASLASLADRSATVPSTKPAEAPGASGPAAPARPSGPATMGPGAPTMRIVLRMRVAAK